MSRSCSFGTSSRVRNKTNPHHTPLASSDVGDPINLELVQVGEMKCHVSNCLAACINWLNNTFPLSFHQKDSIARRKLPFGSPFHEGTKSPHSQVLVNKVDISVEGAKVSTANFTEGFHLLRCHGLRVHSNKLILRCRRSLRQGIYPTRISIPSLQLTRREAPRWWFPVKALVRSVLNVKLAAYRMTLKTNYNVFIVITSTVWPIELSCTRYYAYSANTILLVPMFGVLQNTGKAINSTASCSITYIKTITSRYWAYRYIYIYMFEIVTHLIE